MVMEDLKTKMLQTIAECQDTITVEDVCGLFVNCVRGLEQRTDSIQNIKNKVTRGEYNMFMNAIISTFFSALYLNCDISKEEQKKRIKEFHSAFSDVIKDVGIMERKKTPLGDA